MTKITTTTKNAKSNFSNTPPFTTLYKKGGIGTLPKYFLKAYIYNSRVCIVLIDDFRDMC